MVSVRAPGPVMVRSLLIDNWPLINLIVLFAGSEFVYVN